MMKIKSGRYGARLALFAGISCKMIIVKECMDKHALAYEISSGLEGEHSRGSLHYVGLAHDFAVRSGSDGEKNKQALDARYLAMVKEVIENLGDDYDVKSYFPKARRIHVEFQPKLPYGRL